MAIAFLAPLIMVIVTSFGGSSLTLAHYAELVSRPLYVTVLWNTLQISAFSTVATVLLAYPIAYHLARQPPRRRAFLLILVLLPFWTSILVKSFAFTVPARPRRHAQQDLDVAVRHRRARANCCSIGPPC